MNTEQIISTLKKSDSESMVLARQLLSKGGTGNPYVDMTAWLAIARNTGISQANSVITPTRDMLSAYTSRGENPFEGLRGSESNQMISIVAKQYGAKYAKQIKQIVSSAAATTTPETGEGYEDFITGSGEETPTGTEGTGSTTGVTREEVEAKKWEDIKNGITDPTIPIEAQMYNWVQYARQFGKDAANAIRIPTDEMVVAYEQVYNDDPFTGLSTDGGAFISGKGEVGPTTPETGEGYEDFITGSGEETPTGTEGAGDYTPGNYLTGLEGTYNYWDDSGNSGNNEGSTGTNGNINIPGAPNASGKVPQYNTETASGQTANGDDPVKNQGTGVVAGSVQTSGGDHQIPGENPGAGVSDDVTGDSSVVTGATGNPDAGDDIGDNVGNIDTSGLLPEEPVGVTPETEPETETGEGTGSTTGSGEETPTVPEEEKSEEEVFDEKMDTNKKIENLNIREGALSYEDWLRKGGIDTQRDFNDAAKAAAQEYDRSIAGYGANAEAMAQAGLSGSGYSDYLTGNAYAARQRSIDTARQTKTLADNASRQGYLNYLEDYENTQRGNIGAAIEKLAAMGLTGESAKNYLGMMGISGDYADYITGVVEEMSAETPDKQALLSNLLSNGITGEAALSYAKYLGFDDATASEVVSMADQLTAAVKASNADSLKATAYADILNNGYKGETAMYYATEILGMDVEAAKALVAQTDKMIAEAEQAAAAKKAAEDEAALADITVDVGSEEIYSWRSLMTTLLGDWTNGAPAQGMIASTPALQLFPQSQRDSIITALYAITDDPGYATKEEGARSAAEKRAAYLINQIAEYYAMEGYTEKQIEKILSYIEGGQ